MKHEILDKCPWFYWYVTCTWFANNVKESWTKEDIETFWKNNTEEIQQRGIREAKQRARTSTKQYHYGITLTRNPTKETVPQFITKAQKMLNYKFFAYAEVVKYAFECYKDGELINEHVHVYVMSNDRLSMKDLKKSLPHNRLDMQLLRGDKIPKTINYIKKDIQCPKTQVYYQHAGLETHYSV
jgi:hypothetical protein